MKILLSLKDPACVQAVLDAIGSGHWTESVAKGESLIATIARCTPHLVVSESPDSEEETSILEDIQNVFNNLPFCLLTDIATGDQWRAKLQQFLDQPVPPEDPRPYADELRFVFLDESLRKYDNGKLKRPQREPGWEKECAHQEGRFLIQLEGGKRHQAAAEHYLQCLLAQQSGLDQEIGYRLAHGSFKALSWSRDLALRWLALLAHFAPDAQLEHLPKPGAISAQVDFVHHEIRVEGLYAAALVTLSKVDPAIEEAIVALVTSSFTGQTDAVLLAESLRLYGVAKFFQEVAMAQVDLMRRWLDLSRQTTPETSDRLQRRQLGLYRDFWRLPFIAVTPEPLGSILRGYHAGTTYVADRRRLPSFLEFTELYADFASKRKSSLPEGSTPITSGDAASETP